MKIPGLHQVPKHHVFKEGDVLVLFGELFGRGYANGIIEQAKQKNMKIIGLTVGRRETDTGLRPLNNDELNDLKERLGGEVINIPMEAGFDYEKPASGGESVNEQLKSVKLNEWPQAKINWSWAQEAREQGKKRFFTALEKVMEELLKQISPDQNVLFVHTMAGGIPRAKILMPVLNRVFKGSGDRFISSEVLMKSDIGKLCIMSFEEVTANTFLYLMEGTKKIRERNEKNHKHIAYVGYGYHGTEILINNQYKWQTYTPYFQGWAKMQLEKIAATAFQNKINATIFNCPEILTNSSSVFVGGELSLYPILHAIEQECKSEQAKQVLKEAKEYLKPDVSFDFLVKKCNEFHHHPLMQKFFNFEAWPMNNEKEPMELMLSESEFLVEQSADPKDTLTLYLSQVVIKSTGLLMFEEAQKPTAPVLWLGHDVMAKAIDHW